jgi:hypothetical protein
MRQYTGQNPDRLVTIKNNAAISDTIPSVELKMPDANTAIRRIAENILAIRSAIPTLIKFFLNFILQIWMNPQTNKMRMVTQIK